MPKPGHIKIHRSIEDWEWADDSTMFYFWVRILIKANWEDKIWHGTMVRRGTLVTTLSSLANELKLSVKQVRTCIERLKKGKEITVDTANNRHTITICKYDDYQLPETTERQMNGKCDGILEGKLKATTKEEYNPSDTNVSSYYIQETKNKGKEIDTIVSTKKDSHIDYNYVMRLWNNSMQRVVPKVTALSDSRKEKVRLRVYEMGGWAEAKNIILSCFQKINDSDFCNGTNDQGWKATFDWFFANDKNWIKVVEGNYDNRRKASLFEQNMDVTQKAKNLIGLIYGSGNERTEDRLADTPDEQ